MKMVGALIADALASSLYSVWGRHRRDKLRMSYTPMLSEVPIYSRMLIIRGSLGFMIGTASQIFGGRKSCTRVFL